MANHVVELHDLLSKLLLAMQGTVVHLLQSKGCRAYAGKRLCAYSHHSQLLPVRIGNAMAIIQVYCEDTRQCFK